MQHHILPEYGRIPRSELSRPVQARLDAIARNRADRTGVPVLDTGHRHHVRALNYVGMIQVPGLTLEIVPKIDDALDASSEPAPVNETARHNLLYMLAFTKKLPLQERDLASMSLRRMTMPEALRNVFAWRLAEELRRGVDHAYVRREDNLPFVKGKILLHEDLRRNVATRERISVAYDDFLPDTSCNRILKRGCRVLLAQTVSVEAQQHLREALAYLDQVADIQIRLADFERLHLDRNNRRFEPYVNFCRMLLLEASPTTMKGGTRTFSLLFPMETLFEEFVARYLWRYASEFGTERQRVHIQASRQRRYLLVTESGKRKFRLKPDIVLTGLDKNPQIIVDTKWKRLRTDAEDNRNGVSQADLYQMYAYANRYECPDNLLLFPKVPGVTNKGYLLAGHGLERRLRIGFVDMSLDLRRETTKFRDELKRLVCSWTGSEEVAHKV